MSFLARPTSPSQSRGKLNIVVIGTEGAEASPAFSPPIHGLTPKQMADAVSRLRSGGAAAAAPSAHASLQASSSLARYAVSSALALIRCSITKWC